MLANDLKETRSQFLEGKTELTNEDIIHLLDLSPEKTAANIEIYTEKSYKELKENPEELARLTKELTSAKYLRYKETFISKSKLLYEQSSVLYNEIPCLIVLNEMKIPAYLLPYEYAKNKQGDTRHFADSLKENAFTDFKRVFNTKIRHSFENGMEQGRDIFFLVNNEKLDKEEIKKQLEKLIKFHKGPDKQGLFLFYSEKDYKCFSFESDYSGKITENNDYELKKLRLAISDKPFTPNLERTNTNERPRSDKYNIAPTDLSVNELFYLLLKRGEITALASLKDLSDRENRYFEAISDMERTNNAIFSDFLKKSNTAFLLKEKQSRFYKDILKIKLQGDKSMPSEKKELNISEEEAVRIQLAREIRQNMPNLSDGERAAALAILEAGAASMKMTLRDYVQTTFPHGVFGDFDKAQNAAQQQGVEINGAVSVSGFGANARAVIYASKTADFSTWCHELSHIWQVQLTGELKVNAEKVFQIQNGNWQESTYTFADGHTDTSAEAFAYGFEDFLKHKAGEMAAEDKKAIFEKFADYMSRTYNGIKENIKVNEDIAKVYEQFVQLDDNILAEAEKAVRMEKDLYDSKKNINALLNSPDLRSSKKVSKTLGYVSPQFSRLAKQYGYDIEGFRHTIDNFFINHANNRHSTARTETARGNVAITNDDILNIAKVYESPDYIIFGTKTKTGNPAIVYAKNMGNATVFVEDVRSGKKELAAETLYKKSGAIDVSSKKEAPELYAHSDPESISIVDVKKEFVNHIANGELIFQAAYHGSGASFDHFDTEHYGLSGEGSMSFGWGTYLTESEAIARDYADRQNGIGKKLDSLLKKYPDLYSHITPIYNHMSLGDSFEEAKKNYVGYLRENHIPGIRKITKSIEELKAEDFAELFKKDRNLYTVSIPDGKYLSWNNDVPEATKTEIAEKLHSHLVESDPESYSGNAANYLRQELESLFESEMDGQRFYGSLADYLGSERQASEFLKESGYTGISYPAGTIYGNGNGATNYVIFNDDDIEIKEHLQFQTRTTEQKERKKIEVQTYKFQNGETIDEILSKQTSWATDEEFLDNMIDNSLREVADFADEKENELLKKISIAKNNPEVDLKLLAVQTDAAARYMSAKHYDYRLADVGNRPFSKDFINPYAQDDFPYELPSWIKNHLEEYPNQNEPEHTSEEEKAYQEWEEMLEDNQREENIISHNVLKTKDSEKNISNTQREENSYLNSEELKSSLKKALNEIAKPLEVIPFTRENYNLLFPHSHIISPIENVKLGEHQFEKLDIKERQHILKAVHDTVATPDIIINEKRKTVFDDEKEAHVYAKAFKIDGKNKAVQSVVVSIEDENVSISTHLREINNVVNKIKMPEQLIFASTEIGQMVERLTGKQLGTVNPTRENEIFAPPVTTIPQNTENSINYHGLTLTKKDIVMQHKSLEKEDLLNVINFSNWTYFNSEKISTKVYDVEISASLYEQLLPSEYKERSIKEDEVVCIQYRKSVLSEEQDQFLIEKFDKNNFMLLQQKEIQIDVELKNKIKSICNSYIEPQNNNSYTAEILDKIRAAGIEVVTDKDEFDRILQQKEKLQKMSSSFSKIDFGTVEQWQIEEAKDIGLDLSDYKHQITSEFITHVIKHHGNQITEASRGNIAITKDDLKSINEMITSADRVVYGVTRKEIVAGQLIDRQRIIYAKNQPDGTSLYFEEVLEGKKNKRLRGKTFFKRNGSIDDKSLLAILGNNKKRDNIEKAIIKVHPDVAVSSLSQHQNVDVAAVSTVSELNESISDFVDKSITDYVNSKIQTYTVNSQIYGFVHNGKIYLNSEIMNSNAAVHEYTHLWDAYTQKTNPELWNKGLELFKDSKYWNEVISDPNYQDINDDENLVLSEIHSRICGDIAEKVLNRIAELDGEQVKLDTIDWDEETWKYITEEMGFQQFNNVFHRYPYINPELEIRTSNLKDFLSTPMKDLMSEKKISVKIAMEKQVGAVIESIALDNEKSTIKNNNEKSKERHSDAKDYLIQTTRLFLSKLKEKNLPFLKGKEQGSIIIIKPQVVRDAATGKAFTGYTQLMAQALIQALYDQKKLPELEYDLITYDQAKACGTFIKKGSPHITLTNYNRTTNSASKQMYYFKSGCNSPEMIDLHKESIARNRAIKRIRLSLEEKEIPSERQTEEKNKITLLHYEEMTYLKALNKDTEQYFDSLLAEEKNMLTELCKKTPLTQKNVKELAETLRKDRLISTQLSLQKNSERYFDATECIVPEDFIAKAMAAASLGCSLETTEKTIDSITKDLHQTLSKNIDHYDYGKAFEVGEVITEKCIKNCKEMKNQEYEAAELAKKLEQKQQELKKNPINLLMELLNKNDLSNRTIGGYER